MSDSLSLWDILLLNGDIDVGEWVMLSYIIPIIIIGVISVCVGIWVYRDDIKYKASRLFRRRK